MRLNRPPADAVRLPSQSWKSVSSPASHLSSASSRESPPDVVAPSHALVSLDSPFSQADRPLSPIGGAESCFVPHDAFPVRIHLASADAAHLLRHGAVRGLHRHRSCASLSIT